jgi:DNA (cytosine-5)-methyltransferase 1
MGFDDPTGSEFIITVSDTQAYRQFGNSVVVPVVKAVAQHMRKSIVAAMAVEN